MALAYARPGDPTIDSKTWNELVAAEARRKRTPPPRVDPPALPPPYFAIRIKNGSGSNCDEGHILGISNDALITPANNLREFKKKPCLVGVTPAVPDHRNRYVVCLEPIANGKPGYAAIAGVVPVQVNISDVDDEFADIKDADRTQLQSGLAGARIIYKPNATGTQWCYVFLSPKPATGGIAKTDGSGVTARSGTTPGSGTITPYKRNSGGTMVTRNYTATAYNNVDVAVGNSKDIQYKIDDQGDLWVDVENCPA